VANTKARFSRGATETLLDQDLSRIREGRGIEQMIESLQAQFGRLDVPPAELEGRNARSAYFKTMFLAFRQDGAKDWTSNLSISLSHFGKQHFLQFHHIFPRAVLKGLPLTAQCIPEDPSLLAIERFPDFLVQRRQLIAERLNRFLSDARTK
jgi:hypothetical protein